MVAHDSSVAFTINGRMYAGNCDKTDYLTNIVLNDNKNTERNSAMPISIDISSDEKSIQLTFRICESRKRPRFSCIHLAEYYESNPVSVLDERKNVIDFPEIDDETWSFRSLEPPKPPKSPILPSQPIWTPPSQPQPSEPLLQTSPTIPIRPIQDFDFSSLLVKNSQQQMIIAQQQMIINQLMNNNIGLQNALRVSISLGCAKCTKRSI